MILFLPHREPELPQRCNSGEDSLTQSFLSLNINQRRRRRRTKRRKLFLGLKRKMDKKTLAPGKTLPMTTVMVIGERLRILGFKTLAEYRMSPLWAETKRRMTLESKRPKVCEACGEAVGLSLHHRSYKTLGKEKLSHLCWLCENCHEMVHKLCVNNEWTLWKATRFVVRRKTFMQRDNFDYESCSLFG